MFGDLPWTGRTHLQPQAAISVVPATGEDSPKPTAMTALTTPSTGVDTGTGQNQVDQWKGRLT